MEFLLTVFFFALGAIVSSFVSVVVERVYTGQSWVSGRSRCDSCTHVLDLRDMIPAGSWLMTGGRCRVCGSRVPVRHLVVEGVSGTMAAISYVVLGLGMPLFIFLAILAVLLFIVLYDLRHTIVPNTASLALVLLSALYAYTVAPDYETLGLWCITAGVTGLFFFALFFFSRGRAMGLGDTPVALALALLAGDAALSGFLFSFWIGAVIGIGILVLRRGGPTMGIEVPFVPFLAVGYLLAFFTQWNPFLF